MEIELFYMNKRDNSTKTPNGNGLKVECTLKDNTSIYNPTFLLYDSTKIRENYVKWENRYYYVDDKIYNGNINVEYVCKIDWLATFKQDLLNTSCFVIYASNKYNTDIVDERLAVEKDVVITRSTTSIYNNDPCVYVSWIGQQPFTDGIISYLDLLQLKGKLTDSGIMDSLLKDANDYLSKIVSSATDCLVRAILLPITPNTGLNQTILLGGGSNGGYNTGIGVNILSYTSFGADATVSIPWQFNDFRNRSQFTQITLQLPGIGDIPLNADEFNGQDSITLHAEFDAHNGDIAYSLGNRYRWVGNVGTPLQVSSTSSTNQFVSAVGGVADFAAGAGMGNPYIMLHGLGRTITASTSHSNSSIGGVSGRSGWEVTGNVIACTVATHNTTVSPSSVNAIMGQPLYEITSLSSLSDGYVQCVNPSVSVADSQAKAHLNSLLESGVYLE